jgi:hypothetical protein
LWIVDPQKSGRCIDSTTVARATQAAILLAKGELPPKGPVLLSNLS